MTTVEMSRRTDDVPDHETADTSSIGGVGPPRHASFGRLKGFYIGGVVNDNRHYSAAIREFLDGRARLHWHESDSSPYTRVQYRAICDGNFIRKISERISPWVEAVVPLTPGIFGEDPVLVYFSENAPSRQSSKADFLKIRENISRASGQPRRTVSELTAKSEINGYTISILSDKERHQSGVHKDVYALYERFGWNEENVAELLGNPDNIIGVARKEDAIVAAGIGEIASIPVNGAIFRIAELTEAATRSDHERNGCYAAISTTILLAIREQSQRRNVLGGEIDVIFGESNGLSEGVLRVAVSQGRTFSTDTTARFGFPGSGILRQQVPISGPVRETEYNDLLVTSLTRKELYEFT